jgi:hypothetical protein
MAINRDMEISPSCFEHVSISEPVKYWEPSPINGAFETITFHSPGVNARATEKSVNLAHDRRVDQLSVCSIQ